MPDLQQGEAGTWHLILDADGEHISETDPENLAKYGIAKGQTSVELDHRPDYSVERWDAASQSLQPVPQPEPPAVIDVSGLSDTNRAAVEQIVATLKSGDASVVASVVDAIAAVDVKPTPVERL